MSNAPDDSPDDSNESSSRDASLLAQHHYDHESSHDLTTTIVFAVAEAKGIDPTDFKSPLLYDCVDAAALEESLFGPRRTQENRQETAIEFEFDDYRVRVQSDGWVLVYE